MLGALSLFNVNKFLVRFNVFHEVSTRQHGYRCRLHPVATVSAVCCSRRVTGEQPENRWKYNSHPVQELLLKLFFFFWHTIHALICSLLLLHYR